MFGNPMEIALVVGAAVLLFGAESFRSSPAASGNAKKEFVVGQAEADIAAEKAKSRSRAPSAEADAAKADADEHDRHEARRLAGQDSALRR